MENNGSGVIIFDKPIDRGFSCWQIAIANSCFCQPLLCINNFLWYEWNNFSMKIDILIDTICHLQYTLFPSILRSAHMALWVKRKMFNKEVADITNVTVIGLSKSNRLQKVRLHQTHLLFTLNLTHYMSLNLPPFRIWDAFFHIFEMDNFLINIIILTKYQRWVSISEFWDGMQSFFFVKFDSL